MSKIINSAHGIFANISQVKNAAGRLKKEMKQTFNVDMKISEALEFVSKQFGFKNYNTLRASLSDQEYSKYKIIEYNLTFKNEELKKQILKKINESIPETKKHNADYYSTIQESGLNIVFTSYFNPDLTTTQPKDLTILLICEYKKEMLNNDLVCIKTERVKREEVVDLNKSLLKAINKKQ